MFDGPPTQMIEASDSTSRTLLERVRLRDPQAWRRLVHLYGPTIFGWAERASLQAHDAADVTQEVFQAVAANIDRFRRDRPTDTFRGWLRIITTNKVRDLFRKRPQHAVGTADVEAALARIPVDDADAPEADPMTVELAHRALELIQDEFEPATWQAFLRTTVDGRTVAETAVELGLTPAAVYKAKSRVTIRLRREFDGLLD
jgi:RNA polymerase sigma-70 factor (ECF subfamily)